MTRLIFGILLFTSFTSLGQTKSNISIIDFVKIKNDKRKEALYFYENNWKIYRDSALKNNYITSYRLLTTNADSVANFDIILITEYHDSLGLKLSEERFEKIIKAIRPNGPKLLNDFKPNDFRKIVFTKETETLFYPDPKQK